jgi:hypothetical protein
MRLVLLCGALAAFWTLLAAPSAQASFGIDTFTATTSNEDGSVDLRAGSHPFAYTIHFAMNLDGEGEPEGTLYSLALDLPTGLYGNPQAIPTCAISDFDTGIEPSCPGRSQIGVVHADAPDLPLLLGLYNLEPPPGALAAFGFGANGTNLIERLTLAADGTVKVSAPVLPGLNLQSITETIWGVPAASSHDPDRLCIDAEGSHIQGCSTDAERAPLLTLPTSCDGPLLTTITVTSAEQPAIPQTASAESLAEGGTPEGLHGCEGLPFDPRLSVRPEAHALSPSGLLVDLELPQTEAAELPATAALSQIVLRMPPGIALNPPAAQGLAACSPAEVGLESVPGEQPPRFDAAPVTCPDASKLGTVEVQTPLLNHPLPGAIYLAVPAQNASGARFAIYAVLEDPASGTVLKLPARLDPDPTDGRLAATVPDLPQLPFSEIELAFHGGPRALLTTPPVCGTYTTQATFTPRTAPEASAVQRKAPFKLTIGPAGAPCPPPEPEQPNVPDLQAGTAIPIAGEPSPFVARLARADTTQHLSSFDLDLPPGLLADLNLAASCPETSIGAAAQANAAAEQAEPSCPPDSAIGTATIAAGVGSAPLYLTGEVYLSGPYKGAPFSLTAVVPALAGPFDLGTITERIAVGIDLATAQLSARADPLPEIIAGVPLELRSLALDLDRPGFIRNPTFCAPLALTGTSTSVLGLPSPLSNRFQVRACAALPFKPRLALDLSGGVARNGHPALRAVLRAGAKEAGIAAATITLPAGELLDLHHVRALCARHLPPERCPDASRLGFVRLWSPFLKDPLQGPVYLRVPAERLPDLLVDLRAPQLHLVLDGHTAAPSGRLRIRFPALPDAPLSKAVVTLAGGRRGIFVNSETLCARPRRAAASFSAHNGKQRRLRPLLRLPGRC